MSGVEGGCFRLFRGSEQFFCKSSDFVSELALHESSLLPFATSLECCLTVLFLCSGSDRYASMSLMESSTLYGS